MKIKTIEKSNNRFIIMLSVIMTFFVITGCTVGEDDVEIDKSCSKTNLAGECPENESCFIGECTQTASLCSNENQEGICELGKVCENGTCVDEPDECSTEFPDGVCETGKICENGQCIEEIFECSPEHLDGVCDEGKVCDNGECKDEVEQVDLKTFGTFTGKWAQMQLLPANTVVYGINNRSTSQIFTLAELVQNDDNTISVSATLCDIDVEVNSPAADTIIPTAFIEHVPVTNVIYEYAQRGDEIIVTQAKDLQVRGVNLEDPENDNMPENPDDPRVFDQDEDGNPGMTIQVKIIGIPSGMFIAQRTSTELNGKIIDDNSFGGAVIWNDEQAVLGAENERFNQPMGITPILEESYFINVRVPENYSCQDVLDNANTIFPEEE